MNLPPKEFLPSILTFKPLFSKPVWESAVVLVGAVLAPRKRTISAILQVMGLHHDPHFQNYHRVLSRAIWSSRQASHLLLQQLVNVFVPNGTLVMLSRFVLYPPPLGEPTASVNGLFATSLCLVS